MQPYLMLGIFSVGLLVLCGYFLLKSLADTGIHVSTRSLASEIVDSMAEEMLLEEVQGLVVLL
jgi:hypothetical protein